MIKNDISKKLPIGIQTFAHIRTGNYYYVDKTPHLLELVKEKYIFLSRPRRFGKSLTIDTIAELFSGNKALFTGLYAENHWDWETVYPVIRISFTEEVLKTPEHLRSSIMAKLHKNAQTYDITLKDTSFIGQKFNDLIDKLAEKQQSKVVILIDEYDKPMLDNLGSETIITVRDILRDLYSVIKGQDANIRFAMLTGVSKFSKVNVFSGLNNLYDISIQKDYSALCGYTQDELETVFAPELNGVDMELVKKWYNGYNWTGESVYNPFDILLFFKDKTFRPYWFETGSSTWLIDNLVTKQLDMHSIENKTYSSMDLIRFDIDALSPIAILFQTGYLTINQTSQRRGIRYTLKYPNIEVQQSLNEVLLHRFIHPKYDLENNLDALYDYLLADDFDNIKQVFHSFFASIPHQWYDTNQSTIAHYEGFWASVFYGFLTGLGVRIHTEDSTNQGRMDIWFDFNDTIYILEFKVAESSKQGERKKEEAIKQIKEKNYVDKFKAQQIERQKPIVLMGVVFGEAERNIVDFAVEIEMA